jgi:hypothetical protein
MFLQLVQPDIMHAALTFSVPKPELQEWIYGCQRGVQGVYRDFGLTLTCQCHCYRPGLHPLPHRQDGLLSMHDVLSADVGVDPKVQVLRSPVHSNSRHGCL